MNTSLDKVILTVSQLNRRTKQLLATHLPLIWISGEISNLAKPASGHWYFSLKDEKAQVRCAMFHQTNQRLRWDPKSGQQVLLRARVSLYESRGEYQLIAEHMEAAGTGLLQQQYEQLKNQLESEGLFAEKNKQILPQFPQHIGIITSTTGAAIHDILSVLKRRYPIAPVTLIPVSVQGENAASEMIKALQKAQQFNQFDVLIIGRGGGSIEDLWAFNNEQLARTIAACPIPIVSAVGHEVDFTIADFVADQRAPTPSVSAEIITPDISEWLLLLDYYHDQLQQCFGRKVNQQQKQCLSLKKRLRHPGEKIHAQKKQLDFLKKSLIFSMAQKISLCQEQIKQYQHRLSQQHPSKRIREQFFQLQKTYKQLHQAIDTIINSKKFLLMNKVDVLNAINPLNVLSRGYAIVNQTNGMIVRDSDQVAEGEEVTTQLAHGSIVSVIKKRTK
ncbi:exodeoxyribonuclease VII large subunit [Candidatus Endobugula sertula]|uniref:Exodeoxyribonuclease 7 large subunit n=1 Tax=Candidatus Endobugula sertula TaxID=62101 RepID=A0A1D2QU25_9GAMM|nr:exodeoxyribonuclease VII large subunit [Candidatus Endobugula sertula]